ncbi:MAG TPA: TetR/AcrR family transcriptional regulator [Solirubrobacterales bacterium]
MQDVTSKPRPPRLTRQERRRLTREQLLVSAREVFEERGFADSSLEEIAERAGFTRKAVYSNFSGKAELLLEIVERRFQSHIDQVEAIIGEGPAGRQALDLGAVFSAYFSRERAWEMLFFEFCSVASRDEEIGRRFRARFRESKRAITRLVEQETEKRGVELTMPPERFVNGVFALFSGISLEKLIDPARTDDALFGEMLGMIAAGVLAPGRRASGREAR